MNAILRSLVLFGALCALTIPSFADSSATITQGTSVTLSVTADGTAPFQFQWYRGGTTPAPISGATSSSYNLPSIQLSNAGPYYVVVSNVAGSTTSDIATLIVNALAAPLFSLQPVSQAVNAGSTVVLKALASGTPTPTYQWSKDGTAISGATSANLTLSGATLLPGSYTVVATNSQGSVTSTAAIVSINTKPVLSPVKVNIP